ncbi:MAG TPA: fatty acid desaturase [Oligoflexus sp.]|uniref:fatty acid desaturase family protein n=1 Tax=Oligoflexus sp. TaxID=1971216 RepID=UPI002D8060AF|nr:fatty acid desaturase [Oligoflexus sp.]HET9236663.1 fatty acid desaturase [Oligoflexus sp.]
MNKAKNKSFEDSLRQRINEHFASRYGSKKPKLPRLYSWYYAVCLAAGFLFPAAIVGKYMGVFQSDFDVFLFPLLAIVSAIASSLTFMGFAHALSHNELFEQDSWAGRVFKFISWDCLITISEYVWDNVHNKSHHAFTNLKVGDAEKDLDVILITNNLKQQQSAAKVLFLISIAQVVRFFRQFLSIIRLHRNYEKIHFNEWLVILAGKAYALAIFFVLPYLAFDSLYAPGLGLLYLVTQSVILVPIFLVAHTTADVKFYEVPGPKAYKEISFQRVQIETSANFAMDSRFMFWVTGGLTYQIEHHTFPDIHPHFYPEISLIIREECKKYGVSYVRYEGYWEAVRAVMKFLCDGTTHAVYQKPPQQLGTSAGKRSVG